MSLISLVLIIVVLGLVAGLSQRAPWIDPTFKAIIWWVCLISCVVVVLMALGALNILESIQVPHYSGKPG